MTEEIKTATHHPADTNGDGKVTKAEEQMYLEFKRKELEDADAMRDAQRKMIIVISFRSSNCNDGWIRFSR